MNMEPLSPADISKISPERGRIAKIFQTYVKMAIAEIGSDYNVTFQGRFATKPIRIEIEIDSQSEIP
jgi:hypothetical protein